MYSVNSRLPQGEPDLPLLQLTERVRGLCGAGITPHKHDDGSFTIQCAQEAEAQRIQAALKGANFRMRDRHPWKID